MERRRLGSSGVELSRVVLGCGNFGGIGSAPELFGRGESDEQAFAIMDAAWELGIRSFDTADAYGGGRSESAIGAWIAATGHVPVLTTKTYNPMSAGADHGLSRDRILRQIETSLSRLGVSSVDLYLAHDFDPETPVAETIETFETLVEREVIRAYGVSNVDAPQLEELLAAGRPSLVQNAYSLLEQAAARSVLALCRENGVAFEAFSPLAGGWLTGKYRRNEAPPEGSRMTQRPEPYERYRDESVYAALDSLAAAANDRDVDCATLALAWLLAQPDVTALVVGPRRPDQLDAVEGALRLRLTPDEAAAVARLFRTG